MRYSPKQQAEIVQFVKDLNEKHGRAGQASASKKYGVSALTISKWLKAGGKRVKEKAKAVVGRLHFSHVAATDGTAETLKRMLEIQTKLGSLRDEYGKLRERL